MINYLLLIIGIFLVVVSLIDWKFKAVPSVLLTTMLFVAAFLSRDNLFFGIMAFIMAYLLYELEFYTGVADLKVMATLGFLISSTNMFLIFVLLTVIFGFIWKIILKRGKSKDEEIAFIPVFLFIYITLLLIGGIKW